MTLALQVRSNSIATSDYPTSNFIENIGVRPDFEANYMTKENLLQSGLPFVRALLYGTAYVIRNPGLTAVPGRLTLRSDKR